MRKKRETKKNLEKRIRKEEQEKFDRQQRRTGNFFVWSGVGAIVGIILMGGAGIGGAIMGAITGGIIGSLFADLYHG